MEDIVKRAARGHRARPFFCAPDPSPTPFGTHAPRSFLTIFVLCALAFHLPLSLAPDALFGPLSRFTAAVVGDLLRWLGQPAVVAGDAIRVGPFKARVIGECLALQPMALYAAFVVAFPARWREKGAGLAGGVALLQGLNIVRITLLIWIGVTAPALFGPSHIYLGQMVMIAAVLGLALGWCRRTGPVNERPQRPSLNYLSRFLFFTSLLFLAWLPLNRPYMGLLDSLIEWLFSLAGYHLLLPRDHTLYFQTFGMVTFAGLVLAMRSHPPLRKCRFLISGFLLLTLFQLFLRLCNVWLAAFQIGWLAPVAQVVYHLCVYALPVIVAAVLLIRDRCQILTKPSNFHTPFSF